MLLQEGPHDAISYRLSVSRSNPVSVTFTVGSHTTAFVWILQNLMPFCSVLSKDSAHFWAIPSINIAGSVVHLSETVTTLGVNLDQTLSLQQHVSNLCKSSYYHLRALRHIRASLPDDICFSVTTALIQSRLDYSNSILYGTSASKLHKLQMVQNALARTITCSPCSVSTSQLLCNLHWLPSSPNP